MKSYIVHPFRKLAVLGLVSAMAVVAVAPALAAPREQSEHAKHGYFGTVTSVSLEDTTFTLDASQGGSYTVHVLTDTEFRSPKLENFSLGDLENARVAILTSEVDGNLTALKVMLVPGEPQRKHLVGTVVEVEGSTLVLVNAQGEEVTVEFDGTVSADLIGELATFIAERGAQSNRFKANAEVKVRQILERLQAHAEQLRGQARAEANAEARAQREQRLADVEARLEAKLDLQVQRLTAVIDRVPQQARARIEAVLDAHQQRGIGQPQGQGRGQG